MPETRYQPVAIFDRAGKLLDTEQVAYEVSDGELAAEEVRKVASELAAADDAQLTLAQLAKLVRVLARATG